MTLLSHLLDPQTQSPRSGLFWVVLGGVILAQLVALWMLCSQQVRVAQARQTQVQVQRVALSDCLQYVPGATVSHCNSRISRDDRELVFLARKATAVMGAAPSGGTIPVVYSR